MQRLDPQYLGKSSSFSTTLDYVALGVQLLGTKAFHYLLFNFKTLDCRCKALQSHAKLKQTQSNWLLGGSRIYHPSKSSFDLFFRQKGINLVEFFHTNKQKVSDEAWTLAHPCELQSAASFRCRHLSQT